jgi:hypothetical protein
MESAWCSLSPNIRKSLYISSLFAWQGGHSVPEEVERRRRAMRNRREALVGEAGGDGPRSPPWVHAAQLEHSGFETRRGLRWPP